MNRIVSSFVSAAVLAWPSAPGAADPVTERLTQHIYQARPSTDSRRIAAAILKASRQCNIDHYIVTALMEVESGFRPDATSETGARGLMQIISSTAKDLELPWELAYDIELNTVKGACYFARHLRTYGGRIDLAARRYNGNDDPMFARKVLTSLKRITGQTETAIVVRKGDTLVRIAEDFLGDRREYSTIARINNLPDPNRIEPGMTLYLRNVDTA